MNDNDPIIWADYGWDVVKAEPLDRRAYNHWRQKCVVCGKAEQQVAGNPRMPGVKTHCYECFHLEEQAKKKEGKR